MKSKYTKKEIESFIDNTDIKWERLPFWVKIRWNLFGPPGNTGPR